LGWTGLNSLRAENPSDIFLRLIKVIVAPLILGTLITGWAGHGDLRKVGGSLESLLYFEVITTIAWCSASWRSI